jgi:hypothetical protein
VSDRELNDTLADVADELIFHLATDPAVRFQLLDQIRPARKGAAVKKLIPAKRVFKNASKLFRSKLT